MYNNVIKKRDALLVTYYDYKHEDMLRLKSNNSDLDFEIEE